MNIKKVDRGPITNIVINGIIVKRYITSELPTLDEIPNHFKFIYYRQALNTTLAHIGRIIGVSESYISHIEKGRREPTDEQTSILEEYYLKETT